MTHVIFLGQGCGIIWKGLEEIESVWKNLEEFGNIWDTYFGKLWNTLEAPQ